MYRSIFKIIFILGEVLFTLYFVQCPLMGLEGESAVFESLNCKYQLYLFKYSCF